MYLAMQPTVWRTTIHEEEALFGSPHAVRGAEDKKHERPPSPVAVAGRTLDAFWQYFSRIDIC
jgi:hypothetical protein